MQASGSVDPGSNPSWGVIFLQKLSGKSEQDFGILRKVVNSYFKKILIANYDHNRKYPKMCLNFTIFRQMESSVSVHVNEMSLNCWQMT